MSLLKRRTVDNSVEERLLTGLIVSDSFCRDIFPLLDKEIIETPYMQRVSSWCKDYYKQYKQAPSIHIKDIYEIEKENLDKSDQEAISLILNKISEQYESSSFNEDFLKDEALRYIDIRSLKISATKALAFAEVGRIEEAREAQRQYRKISVETSGWEDPFLPETIRNHFADEQSKKSSLFKLVGPIGDFIGAFERNWLVGFMGPPKRGKTFWLIEMAVQGLLAKKKVVFVSLEMDMQRIRRRIYNRLTSFTTESRDYIYPVFDCIKNQNGSCNKPERTNNLRLLDSEGQKPQFNREIRYSVCTACKGNIDFFPGTWFTTFFREKSKINKTIRTLISQSEHLGFNKETGSNMRVLAYPAFSANLSRLKNDIWNLVETKNFIPDIISLDYADILAPEDSRIVGRERIDQTWKTLKGLTDELHCCTFTGSQSNRGSIDKKNVTQQDTSEDIRKIANSDLFLAINQTPQEKKSSITRISKIAKRDGDFDQYASVIALQQLSVGQVCLDSYLDIPTNINQNIYEDFFE